MPCGITDHGHDCGRRGKHKRAWAKHDQNRDRALIETISDNRGVMIVVVNSCETAPLFEADGMLKSAKIDLRYHGYGIKSILRVVKKYHGSHKMYYDPAEKEFHFIIQFPFIA